MAGAPVRRCCVGRQGLQSGPAGSIKFYFAKIAGIGALAAGGLFAEGDCTCSQRGNKTGRMAGVVFGRQGNT